MENESKTYSTKEVAQIFETSEDVIRRLYRSGELGNKENGYRSKKDGISFSEEEIRNYLESHPQSKYRDSVNKKILTATAIASTIASTFALGVIPAMLPLAGIAQSVGLIAIAKMIGKEKEIKGQNIREQLEAEISNRKNKIKNQESIIETAQKDIEELKSEVCELEFLLDHMDTPTLDLKLSGTQMSDKEETN